MTATDVIRVPLKLVLAGEYAVLSPGGRAVVAALDRSLAVTLAARADQLVGIGQRSSSEPATVLPLQALSSHDGGQVDCGVDRLRFVREALVFAYDYVEALGLERRGVDLGFDASEALHGGCSMGLGLSAAIVVGTVSAVLAVHGLTPQASLGREVLLRLALAAHDRAQGGLGSGVDVAVSCCGDLLHYQPCERAWWQSAARRQMPVLELVRCSWPGLRVDRLRWPRGLALLAGYTGTASLTAPLIEHYQTWRGQDNCGAEHFSRRSLAGVDGLVGALEQGHGAEVLNAVVLAQDALDGLQVAAGMEIVTPILRRAIATAKRCGAAAKVSGAGGGDCCIAVVEGESKREQLASAWTLEGLEPLLIDMAHVRERPA